ncbi:class F sortase [Sphaerisporangium melleum]|nr:class F sortase [Sphaerisporangium melleum]
MSNRMDAAPGGLGRPLDGRWRKAMAPVLLTAGSLAGIGAVMAGLLIYLTPASDPALVGDAGQTPFMAQMGQTDGAGQGSAGSGTGLGTGTATVNGAEMAPLAAGTATVGPGGANSPLVAAAPAASPPSPAARPGKPLRKSPPVRVRIPRIGVDAALVSLGVDRNREIEVPPLNRPKLAGWYRLGPAPGEMGPAVILGHVNTRSGPAVFSRLRELTRGDTISVVRADGSVARFTVDGAEQASKNRFPTKRVYGHVDRPSLRLITCGGVFNPKAHSYTDNIIVYATLSGSR